MSNIIVFHTAWMTKYDGDRSSFSPGGFKVAVEQGFGHEMYNFREISGRYYGYVPPTGNLHFEKHFPVRRHIDVLKDVTVVWTAPHPEQGGRAVIGLWRKADVYRHDQKPIGHVARRRKIGDATAGYRCVAETRNCVLLSPESRPIFVSSRQKRAGQSWPGQQKVFYPKRNSPALNLLLRIVRDIEKGKLIKSTVTGQSRPSGWQADVERRRQIEVAAILAVGTRLEGAGFAVHSVESDNLGYDLVATRGQETLHVEVKGRSGAEVSADFTANEYDCLKLYRGLRQADWHYRIAIVTNALSRPRIHEFAYVQFANDRAWLTLDGKWRLEFEEKTAARLTATEFI